MDAAQAVPRDEYRRLAGARVGDEVAPTVDANAVEPHDDVPGLQPLLGCNAPRSDRNHANPDRAELFSRKLDPETFRSERLRAGALLANALGAELGGCVGQEVEPRALRCEDVATAVCRPEPDPQLSVHRGASPEGLDQGVIDRDLHERLRLHDARESHLGLHLPHPRPIDRAAEPDLGRTAQRKAAAVNVQGCARLDLRGLDFVHLE
ncbi:MAG: hypothetical protein AMJ62_00640 [Myxococcales bacterium SG8_38]|nr:MAG: hypothetical protein AMJ62_00640 [Myxococcales bacterium SG8_38]